MKKLLIKIFLRITIKLLKKQFPLGFYTDPWGCLYRPLVFSQQFKDMRGVIKAQKIERARRMFVFTQKVHKNEIY